MKYKSSVAAMALVAMTGTVQAMSAVEVIDYLNNNICDTGMYHAKPLDNNPNGFTWLLTEDHWADPLGILGTNTAYNNFNFYCSDEVHLNWIPNYVPRTPVPRTPVPRIPVPRGYSHGDISSKGGDFRDNPNYHNKDTHSKYKKNVR